VAVFRVHKTRDFTVMSNHHLRDKNLTLKAKGLLSVILSLPDDWKYSIAGLAAICKEGTSAVKSALQELTDAGYVTVTKLYPNQTETGRIEYVYDIHETPQAPRKQGVENLPLESQQVENQGQLNTDVPSTDKSNTKDKTKKEDKEQIPFSEIISYYNEKTGHSYSPEAKETVKVITKAWKLKPDKTYEERLSMFKKIIDNMCIRWIGTTMEQWLVPSTIFRECHFDDYLNATATPPKQNQSWKPKRNLPKSQMQFIDDVPLADSGEEYEDIDY